jgi:hypothetical protein
MVIPSSFLVLYPPFFGVLLGYLLAMAIERQEVVPRSVSKCLLAWKLVFLKLNVPADIHVPEEVKIDRPWIDHSRFSLGESDSEEVTSLNIGHLHSFGRRLVDSVTVP